jgi:hypothetical protein
MICSCFSEESMDVLTIYLSICTSSNLFNGRLAQSEEHGANNAGVEEVFFFPFLSFSTIEVKTQGRRYYSSVGRRIESFFAMLLVTTMRNHPEQKSTPAATESDSPIDRFVDFEVLIGGASVEGASVEGTSVFALTH